MKGADNVYVKAHINIFISNKGSEHIGYEDKCTYTTGNDWFEVITLDIQNIFVAL